MKAMTKQQLADCAGVSVRTLRRWCEPYREELESMGWNSGMKVLPPRIVAFIVEKLCIEAPRPHP